MTTTLTFYVPTTGDDYPERADCRVRVLDYDEVTMTSRVEFADGLRSTVRASSLTTRAA